MKGPEQEREPKYQEVGRIGGGKKRFKQTLRIKGQEGDIIWPKINVFFYELKNKL